jgi:hypothetical protein
VKTIGSSRARWLLRRPPTLTYLWIDRENSAKKLKVVAAFKTARPVEFLKLWDPDLERANFTAAEIAAGVRPLVGKRVLTRDVAKWHSGVGSLNAWVLTRYGVTISKQDLVPYYLRLCESDLRRARGQPPERPLLRLMLRCLRVVIGIDPFTDPRLADTLVFSR